MTTKDRAGLAALAKLAAAGLLVVTLAACGGDDDPTIEGSPTTPSSTAPRATATSTPADPGAVRIVVEGGRVVEGPERHEVTQGEHVVLEISSDRVDEVHVHSYNIYADVGPEQPATIEFDATIAGVFEVELEAAQRRILELRVSP